MSSGGARGAPAAARPLVLLAVLLLCREASSFYLPGVAPRDFSQARLSWRGGRELSGAGGGAPSAAPARCARKCGALSLITGPGGGPHHNAAPSAVMGHAH